MIDDVPNSCWICTAHVADSAVASLAGRTVCAHCKDTIEGAYGGAWRRLSHYLRDGWSGIVRRGSFDLSKAFIGDPAAVALRVHLYFVAVLGCRLSADDVQVDLASFAAALNDERAHPGITLLVADAHGPSNRFVLHDSEVSMLRSGAEVQSASWTFPAHPVAIKICYIKEGAPIREPDGFPWHPTRQRKLVKLSPYKSDTQPLVARRDLRI